MNAPTNFSNECSAMRTNIKIEGQRLLSLKNSILSVSYPVGSDIGEMIANVTLAYRHLEDSALRLGKAIQAFEGGQGIYDTNDAMRISANGPVQAGNYGQTQQGPAGQWE